MIKQVSRNRPETHSLQKYKKKLNQNLALNQGTPSRQARPNFRSKSPNNILSSLEIKTDRSTMLSLKDSITVKKMLLISQKLSPCNPQTTTKTKLESYRFPIETNLFTKKPLKFFKLLPPRKTFLIKKSSSNSPSPIPSSKKNFLINFKSNTPKALRQSKTQEKISIKEVVRNKDYAHAIKIELESIWRKMINISNGIERPLKTDVIYKYYLGKGNNSKLIRKLMSSRPWWTEAESIDEANFIWTQWKNKEFMRKLNYGDNILIEKKSQNIETALGQLEIKLENMQTKTLELEELGFQYIKNSNSYIQLQAKTLDLPFIQIYNKLEHNQHLTNKKGLYLTMVNYYLNIKENPFEVIPITFHIQTGEKDPEFLKFIEMFNENQKSQSSENKHNLWIIKPGENSNRGQGISVCNNMSLIKSLVSSSLYENNKTFIIQKYIEKPFLIHKRKFDFRCYCLITSINGVLQGYFYMDGYIRTASYEFSAKDTSNECVHLTNDAIQKYCEDYGKFEDGNKMSYKDFQRYLDFHCSEKGISFVSDILPQIKKIAKDSIKASCFRIDPNRRLHCMEILGYDFMMDKNAKVWLIEVNTNPCLELSSNYLAILIPSMVDNAFKISLDPLFPPPQGKTYESLLDNKFELIFHQEPDLNFSAT